MPYRHGMFVWADVAVPDTGAGAEFYTSVLGWEVEELPAPGSLPYSMFRRNGQVVAGMGPLTPEHQQQGIPPMWSSYVGVDDVDRVAEDAKKLGGAVVEEPMDIMDAGRLLYLRDPAGAFLGFWQPGQHQGADVFDQPGAMCWNELATRDAARAVDFYGSLLPWEMNEEQFDGFRYTTILLNGKPNGGIYAMGEQFPPEVPSHWTVYFAVDDTDATVAKIRERGGTVMQEPMDTPFGRMAVASDQQGAHFRVIKLTQPG